MSSEYESRGHGMLEFTNVGDHEIANLIFMNCSFWTFDNFSNILGGIYFAGSASLVISTAFFL